MEKSTRKYHVKSRMGCRACKGRHIKCDEQIPRCANCQVRDTECIYEPPSHGHEGRQKQRRSSRTTRLAEPSTAADNQLLSSTQYPMPLQFPQPAPTAFSSTTESSRLMELRLMHRWSTRTWSAASCTVDDQVAVQEQLPRLALGKSYILNGMFAVAAADAACSGQTLFMSIAHDFSRKATAEVQSVFRGAGKDDIVDLYTFNTLCCIFNFALSSSSTSALGKMTAFLDADLGMSALCKTLEWHDPYIALMHESFDVVPAIIFDPSTQKALDLLVSVCGQLGESTAQDKTRGAVAVQQQFVYTKATDHIRRCFVEQERAYYRAFWISLVDFVPIEYFDAVKRGEPLALLVFLYVGVLVQRSAADPCLWWIASSGQGIVAEVCEMLQQSLLASRPDARLVISWAREQVGLLPSPPVSS